MDVNAISIVAAGIIGGIAKPLFDYFKGVSTNKSSDRKTEIDGFKILKDAWVDQFEELKREVRRGADAERECMERYEELNEKFKSLKAAWEVHRKAYPDLPIPMWMKDTQGVMLALNDAYEEKFLKPLGYTREDYIGNKDEVIWGKEIALEFRENDRKIKNGHDEIRVFEKVKVSPSAFEHYDILKYAKKIDNIVVGIGGIALPKAHKKNKQL